MPVFGSRAAGRYCPSTQAWLLLSLRRVTSTWAGPPPPPHWRAAGQPRLVGRAAELGLLAVAWTAVTDGGRQLVLIGGDGGGGKSRLVIEAATSCVDAGAAVLVGG